MKINIVEINKKKSFDTEIIFVKDIETLKEDKEILEILEFKATLQELYFKMRYFVKQLKNITRSI